MIFVTDFLPGCAEGGSMFEKLGGRGGIAQLVREFYRIMATDPRAARVFATHVGRDIEVSAQKLTAFLTGWTGGPADYHNTYGHPRLRLRHSPFVITSVEAQEWLWCMEQALATTALAPEEKSELLSALEGVTQMLINRP